MKHQISITYDSGEFWENIQDSHSSPYQEQANFARYDLLANGFRWSMAVQGTGQRKRHSRSGVTLSIYAMLDSVKVALKDDAGAIVHVFTPDVEVCFTAY